MRGNILVFIYFYIYFKIKIVLISINFPGLEITNFLIFYINKCNSKKNILTIRNIDFNFFLKSSKKATHKEINIHIYIYN